MAVNLGCAVRLEKPHELLTQLLTHSCCLLCVPALRDHCRVPPDGEGAGGAEAAQPEEEVNKRWPGWFWVLAHGMLGLAWASQPCWYCVEVLCFMGPRVPRCLQRRVVPRVLLMAGLAPRRCKLTRFSSEHFTLIRFLTAAQHRYPPL